VNYGRVRRRQLGIAAGVVRLPKSLVRELDLLADQGVEVADVAAGTAAAAAGLRPGDVIVALNDRLVNSIDDLHRLLSLLPWGDLFELKVVRGEVVRSLVVPASK